MGIRVGSTVLNVTDIDRAVAFWTQALGYVRRDPNGEDDFVVLASPAGDWSNVSLQQTREPKSVVNRVHLDLYADDQTAEVARLERLGATRIEAWPYPDHADFVVMADPDGNEFCVIQAQ